MTMWKIGCIVLLLSIGIAAQNPSQLVPVNPCRLLDTRDSDVIPANQTTMLDIRTLATERCTVDLSTATAYSLNVTLIPQYGQPVSYVTVWSDDTSEPPLASLMNSIDGRIKASAAIVPAGMSDGGINIWLTDPADIVLDLGGYFVPPAQHTLVFYPLTPCRVVDTRNSEMPTGFGPPAMAAEETRVFSLMNSSCLDVPLMSNPVAYSLNFTVLPGASQSSLSYMTVWPTEMGQMPTASVLNNPTATVVSNAAIMRGTTSAHNYGEISVYTTDETELIVDVNGYFAAPVSAAGAMYYPTMPCRVLDTRTSSPSTPFGGVLTVDVKDSVSCPGLGGTSAVGYAMNATVIPTSTFQYLTLYRDGIETPSNVSTVNSIDGTTASNMAVVPTSNGLIDAYAAGATDLVLDAYGYFALKPGSTAP
jgi:hypothetical protein